MAVENFLERMNALVEELKAHPKVTLINYFVPPPATEQDFLDVEAHLGFSLPEDIKAFYRQCNGIQLRWVHKDNKNVDQKIWSGFVEGPFDYEECEIEKYIDGVVNLLPIREAFLTNWTSRFGQLEDFLKPKEYELGGIKFNSGKLLGGMVIFDLFNKDAHFSVVLSEELINPIVCIGKEHHKSLEPDFYTYFSFDTYLEFLLVKKGGVYQRIQPLYLRSQKKADGRTVPWARDVSDPLIFSPTSFNTTYYNMD